MMNTLRFRRAAREIIAKSGENCETTRFMKKFNSKMELPSIESQGYDIAVEKQAQQPYNLRKRKRSPASWSEPAI